jgi:hypothetical protein
VSLIERARRLCLALPEAFELETWGHPTFRVGSGRGKIFCTAAPDGSTINAEGTPQREGGAARPGRPLLRAALRRRQGLGGHPLEAHPNRLGGGHGADRHQLLPGCPAAAHCEGHEPTAARQLTSSGVRPGRAPVFCRPRRSCNARERRPLGHRPSLSRDGEFRKRRRSQSRRLLFVPSGYASHPSGGARPSREAEARAEKSSSSEEARRS